MLADPHFPALLNADQVATLQSATGWMKTLAFACCRWRRPARADLSHFNVGAIARGISGTWYFGGNMEFRGHHAANRARRTKPSHAWLRGEKSLRAITVNYTPAATVVSL